MEMRGGYRRHMVGSRGLAAASSTQARCGNSGLSLGRFSYRCRSDRSAERTIYTHSTGDDDYGNCEYSSPAESIAGRTDSLEAGAAGKNPSFFASKYGNQKTKGCGKPVAKHQG